MILQWFMILPRNSKKLTSNYGRLKMNSVYLESKADFGQEFINKARSVYFLNDERAALKKAVNVLTGSTIVEAKSYIDYTVRGADSQE
jgi:hypothetical protein